jgi:hypothetical protein
MMMLAPVIYSAQQKTNLKFRAGQSGSKGERKDRGAQEEKENDACMATITSMISHRQSLILLHNESEDEYASQSLVDVSFSASASLCLLCATRQRSAASSVSLAFFVLLLLVSSPS